MDMKSSSEVETHHARPDTLPAAQKIPRIMSEMQQAADALQGVGRCVAIFGSARLSDDSPWCAVAQELGQRLAQVGLPVIAGGGPGIMLAANRGAFEQGGTSIGLNICLPNERHGNAFQTHRLYFESFTSRKATFFTHSAACIVLPGGFGTLDELFEVVTLVQTGKLPTIPIVLIGEVFWQGLMDWLHRQVAGRGMIGEEDLSRLLLVTDDVEVAMRHVMTGLGSVNAI